jgi:hypothetical protein
VGNRRLLMALLLAGIATSAFAVSGSANLTVHGLVSSSVGVTLSTSAGTFTQPNDYLLAFGNISKYGSPPAGTTITRTSTSWTLNWTMVALVEIEGATSATYNLATTLNTFPPAGLTWKLQNITIPYGANATVFTAASYGSSTLSYQLIVLDTTPVTSTAATIILYVVSN